MTNAVAMRGGPEGPQRASPIALFLACALALCTVWCRPGPPALYGVDAACYARIARGLALTPLRAWCDVHWGSGEPFVEHPPLGLWLEALFFRLLGASTRAAVVEARVLASLLILLVLGVAQRVAGRAAGLCTVLALPLLPGFLYESQNPMLELPLTVGLGLSVLGITFLSRCPWRGAALFSAGFTCALLTKGPPAFAAWAVLGWAAWRWELPARRVLLAAGASALLAGAGVAAWELARHARGVSPFLPGYLRHQVLESVVRGRSRPARDLLFFPRELVRWYLPALLAGGFACLGWRRWRSGARKRLLELGAVWVAIIVLGFTLPLQKHPWYVHPAMLGAALVVGAAWAEAIAVLGDSPWPTRASLAGVGMAVAFISFLLPERGYRDVAAMEAASSPRFNPGVPRAVADCGPTGPWMATHLFDFLWDAERVPCGAIAAYRFDGERLFRVGAAPAATK